MRTPTIGRLAAACVTATLVFVDSARADPCKAIPDKGRAPAYLAKGKTFSGPVVYVADGDGLCVEVGRRGDRSAWVEVRIEDFYAPELHDAGGREAKATLERIAMGKRVGCVAGRQTWDRVVATCRINGVSIGDQLRATGEAQGGNAWKAGR